jgi:hypothetical protein
MARRKKNISLQIEQREEVMTEDQTTTIEQLELPIDNQVEMMQQELDQARLELEKTKQEIEERKHQLQQLKFTPGREISQEEKRLVEKQITMTNEMSTLSSKIEAQRKRDSELVTGRFMNRRAPGQPVKLPYIKHNTDPVKWYPLEDGKVYTIPRGFADQLNGGTDDDPCYYTPKFIQKQGEMDPDKAESAIHAVDSSNKKYGFVPLNF